MSKRRQQSDVVFKAPDAGRIREGGYAEIKCFDNIVQTCNVGCGDSDCRMWELWILFGSTLAEAKRASTFREYRQPAPHVAECQIFDTEESWLSHARHEEDNSEEITDLVIGREYIAGTLQERGVRVDNDTIDQIMASLEDRLTTRGVLGLIDLCIADLSREATMPNPLKTYADWCEARFMMDWSIFVETEGVEIDDWVLDLSAPRGTPDGKYQVVHKAGDSVGQSGRTKDSYAIVQGGKFDPVSTERAALDAVAQSYGLNPDDVRLHKRGLGHVYIESFHYNERFRYIEVTTGS